MCWRQLPAACYLRGGRQRRQCQVRASSQFIALQLSQSANVPGTTDAADTRAPAVGNPSDRGVYVTWTAKPSLSHIKRVKSTNLTQPKVEWVQKQNQSNAKDRDKGVTQAFCDAYHSNSWTLTATSRVQRSGVVCHRIRIICTQNQRQRTEV